MVSWVILSQEKWFLEPSFVVAVVAVVVVVWYVNEKDLLRYNENARRVPILSEVHNLARHLHDIKILA